MAVIDRFTENQMFCDPHEYYAELRREAPVYFSKTLNAYFVTRMAEARDVLGKPQIFMNAPLPGEGNSGFYNFLERYKPLYHAAGVPVQITTILNDGETHRRYRSLLQGLINPAFVKKSEDQITAIADQLIDRFIGDGQVDLYREFCLKLPLTLVAQLIGLPSTPENLSLMQQASISTVELTGGVVLTEAERVKLHEVQIAFHRMVLRQMELVRENPDDSLLSRLMRATLDGGRKLSLEELMSLVTNLNTGNDSTPNGLGNMFALCFSQPGAEQRLREDRNQIPKFIEEALRIETPVTFVARRTAEDTALGGVNIPADATVIVALVAANRDEASFAAPDHFDPARDSATRHLTFGVGQHFCIGAALARAELRIALNRVLERMQDIRIGSPGGKPIGHTNSYTTRTLRGLPITFRKIVGKVNEAA